MFLQLPSTWSNADFQVEGLVAARPCRFKSCFPHYLIQKDLRRLVVGPFSFLDRQSDPNLTRHLACMGFVLVVGTPLCRYHCFGLERQFLLPAWRTRCVTFS